MARRRNSNLADGLTALVSKLPWWVGVSLALASYVLLHPLAANPPTFHAQPGQMGSSVVRAMGHSLAVAGQYVLPLVCLFGAAISAWNARHRRKLVERAADATSPSVVDAMSWQDFERLVGESFRLHGYRVKESGLAGSDGGVDLILDKDGERHLVQCKQWRARQVGVGVVRELYGAMAAQGAGGGFVVTSGRFTEPARQFAQGRHVRLIDGEQLRQMIQSVHSAASAATPQTQPERPQAVNPSASPPDAPADPAGRLSTTSAPCPLCSSAMVLRRARSGPNTGRSFWGCTTYPRCRGTRPF